MTAPTPPSDSPVADSGLVAPVDPIPTLVHEDRRSAEVDRLPEGLPTYPLFPVDPPKIGDFWPSARLAATESGVAYVAFEDQATAPVMVILLTQGASDDPGARDRFAGEVDRMDIDTVIARGGLGQNSGRLGNKFRSEDDDPQGVDALPQSPWVALAFDQTPQAVEEARRVLAAVDLSRHPPQGTPSGPNYRLHWADRVSPGLTRVWPLPWPGRKDRGGRLTILAAWLLMLLLAAIGVLIAILIFSQAPETPPPPPIPPTAPTDSTESPPPTDSSPTDASPTDASPSPTDASPTDPESASPSESESQSESPSPTEESASPTQATGSPTDEESGPGGGRSTPPRI